MSKNGAKGRPARCACGSCRVCKKRVYDQERRALWDSISPEEKEKILGPMPDSSRGYLHMGFVRERRRKFLADKPPPSVVAEMIESPSWWAENWHVRTLLARAVPGLGRNRLAALCMALHIAENELLKAMSRDKAWLLAEVLRELEMRDFRVDNTRATDITKLVWSIKARLYAEVKG